MELWPDEGVVHRTWHPTPSEPRTGTHTHALQSWKDDTKSLVALWRCSTSQPHSGSGSRWLGDCPELCDPADQPDSQRLRLQPNPVDTWLHASYPWTSDGGAGRQQPCPFGSLSTVPCETTSTTRSWKGYSSSWRWSPFEKSFAEEIHGPTRPCSMQCWWPLQLLARCTSWLHSQTALERPCNGDQARTWTCRTQQWCILAVTWNSTTTSCCPWTCEACPDDSGHHREAEGPSGFSQTGSAECQEQRGNTLHRPGQVQQEEETWGSIWRRRRWR